MTTIDSQWRNILQDLLKETDNARMVARANDLEESIITRLQELGPADSSATERSEIRDATRTLLKIRAEKLGFPVDPALLKAITTETSASR